VQKILRALHLDAIHTEYYSWRSSESEPGAQIDLVIDRSDGIVTICEVKYSQADYTVTKSEYMKMLNREETFRQETKCRKGVQTIMVTTHGVKRNEYSSILLNTITLKELFL